ncbi:type VI secretion system lipoprotein TssJ [Phaeovulum sp.]|uniref:type VI secretion system lipoprotein TssJ n=1 Tax=Phaeovulum sp. TaxID=2934796 RepID=UPI0039E47BC2
MAYLARRTFLITAAMGAGTFLAGCMGDAPPAVVTVSAQGAAGMNPGPGGGDRPVTLTILQLAGAGAFDAADYYALQDPATALGGDLIRADQLVLAPGESPSKQITIQPGTSMIGVVGGFRDPANRTVRAKTMAPGADSGLIIKVGPGGIALTRT